MVDAIKEVCGIDFFEKISLDEAKKLAMEHGMPCMSGLGMGIDRLLVMLFEQPSIRDVVLFPIMK